MGRANTVDHSVTDLDVLVVASLNVDHIVHAPRIPVPGETLLGTSTARAWGGKGGNQVVAAARLGAVVGAVGCVGDDEDGANYLAALVREGVDVDAVLRHAEAPTGLAAVTVDDEGRNSIVVVPGANAKVLPADAGAAVSRVRDHGVVVGQLEVNPDATRAAFAAARARGIHTILNPAPAAAAATQLSSLSDLVVPNEVEFHQLTGRDPFDPAELRRGADRLIEAGATWIVVTLGQHGCVVLDRGAQHRVSAQPAQAVDTTAAGDSFIGAIAATIARTPVLATADVVAAAQFSARAAAITVSRRGAQPSLPRRDELEESTR
ncbi:ribokinase [Leekyejoonella antrihumi]|uniref:Ribokinase n=1 Tax=Leekyejoonella antrihumi TaxID=1660198 RepID=A0A563DU03_9MICO|nr:ribokinase [Leekyejoonella antrihumi]TWP33174.1 ribokinase [Leekyejoonella antrihumi]